MAFDFSTGRKSLAEFSLVGMTDIVMLLIIFFLLTSSFVIPYGIQVNLPQVTSIAPAEDLQVAVTLTAEGVIYVDGEETPLTLLEPLLITAAGNQKEAVLLRADQAATVGQFAEIASAARIAGLRILMATEPRGEQ